MGNISSSKAKNFCDKPNQEKSDYLKDLDCESYSYIENPTPQNVQESLIDDSKNIIIINNKDNNLMCSFDGSIPEHHECVCENGVPISPHICNESGEYCQSCYAHYIMNDNNVCVRKPKCNSFTCQDGTKLKSDPASRECDSINCTNDFCCEEDTTNDSHDDEHFTNMDENDKNIGFLLISIFVLFILFKNK